MRRRTLAVVLLVVGLAVVYTMRYESGGREVAAFLARFARPEGSGTHPLRASGVIQAHEVSLGPLVGGRVERIWVRQGDTVHQGQVLLTLDRSLHEAQMAVARAQVGIAQAALECARAGARPGQIAVAEAELDQARAAHEAAQQGLADLLALRENQQELDLQIDVTEAQIAAAEHRAAQTLALKDAAEVSKKALENMERVVANWHYPVKKPTVPLNLRTAPYQWWKAWVGVNAAEDTLEGQRARLMHLKELREHPQELDAQIAAARAAVEQIDATVAAAQARLDGLRAGASPEQLKALEAQVDQAETALQALSEQGDLMQITAPIDGTVLSLSAHEGEVAVSGATALTMADVRHVVLQVFVPEKRLGGVRVGRGVDATVDSWPGRVFRGCVTRIGDRPEYTPRNVATQEGRMLTFYVVDIDLDNPDGALKPGMPADAAFE